MDAFISHSSRNHARAQRLEAALEAKGLDVWLDDSEIRLGALLSQELQTSIRECRTLVLLWSRPAAGSRWVNSEWLMALHQDVFILPCLLDGMPLPQCLQNSVYLNLRRINDRDIDQLARAIRESPGGPNRLPPAMRSESPELGQAIVAIRDGQSEMNDQLDRRQLDEAAVAQRRLEDLTEKAQRKWPLDPMVVNLVGFHLKNAYMLKHWDALQASRMPEDDLLGEAEARFFETLFIDPHDPSSLNGLGSILMFRHDLDAAEFFQLAAIRAAKRRGIASYPEAEHDLELVRSLKAG